jgi:hypothetical protein
MVLIDNHTRNDRRGQSFLPGCEAPWDLSVARRRSAGAFFYGIPGSFARWGHAGTCLLRPETGPHAWHPLALLLSQRDIVCSLSVALRIGLGACMWCGHRDSPTRRPLLPLNAGTAEPLRVSPPEAVAYHLELIYNENLRNSRKWKNWSNN